MDVRAVITARKYAQAFLNLFIDQIDLAVFDGLRQFDYFLRAHRPILFF